MNKFIFDLCIEQKVRRQNPSITLCPEKNNWKNTTNKCFMASNQMMNYHLMILCLLMDILQSLIFMITHQYQIKILHYFEFLCFVTFKPKSMLVNSNRNQELTFRFINYECSEKMYRSLTYSLHKLLSPLFPHKRVTF